MELADVTPTNSPNKIRPPAETPGPQNKQLEFNIPEKKIFCDNYQDILSKLVCPLCEENFTPPVVICVSGHSFCGKCSPWMTLCTICFEPLTDTRNKNVQNILVISCFKCPCRPEGCNVTMPLNGIVDHFKHCEFRIMKCPAGRLGQHYCMWDGTKKRLLSHVKKHWYLTLEDRHFIDVFSVFPFTPTCKFLFLRKEVFAYYAFILKDRWIFLVEKVGLTPKKFECVFKLEAANGLNYIRVTLPVNDTEEVFSEKISHGNCFKIPVEVMRNFIIDKTHMKVVVFINDVTECTSL